MKISFRHIIMVTLFGAVVCLGLLLSMSLQSGPKTVSNEVTQVRQDFRKVFMSFENLYIKRQPTSDQELIATVKRLIQESCPVDPWGSQYNIRLGSNADVVLISSGPDKRLGTRDDVLSGSIEGDKRISK